MVANTGKTFMARQKTEMFHNTALQANKIITNTTVETEILATRFLRQIDIWSGFNFEVKMSGTLTTASAGTGNDLDIAIRYGSTNIVQFEANGLGTNASEIFWTLWFAGRLTPGATDKIMGAGLLQIGEATIVPVSAKTDVAGTTVNFKNLKQLNVTGQWGTADASNDLNVLAAWIKVHIAQAST